MKRVVNKIIKEFKKYKPIPIKVEELLKTLLLFAIIGKIDKENESLSMYDKAVEGNIKLPDLEKQYDLSHSMEERQKLYNKIQNIKMEKQNLKENLIAEFGSEEGNRQFDILTKPIQIADLVRSDDPWDVIDGDGLKSKRKGLLQTVLFDKSKWNVKSAKKWLKENNHKFSDIDKKENFIRFRQIDPEILKVQHYTNYRTKKLSNGIDLVYVYKKKEKSKFDY